MTLSISHDVEWTFEPNLVEAGAVPQHVGTLQPAFQLPMSQIDNPDVFSVLRGLLEVSVASVVLARLGLPNSRREVVVRVSGALAKDAIAMLERALFLFMYSKGRNSGQQCGSFAIRLIPDQILEERLPFRQGDTEVVAFSGGLDSLACIEHLLRTRRPIHSLFHRYYVHAAGDKPEIALEATAASAIHEHLVAQFSSPWTHAERVADLSVLGRVPFKTMRDDLDNDPWEFCGRNFVTAMLLLFEAAAKGGSTLVLGLTAEDLHSFDQYADEALYSEACQSAGFIYLLNEALSATFDKSPMVTVPLLEMYKGSVIEYLADDLTSLSLSRSCVNDGPTEDLNCFSCFDKFTAILATFDPHHLALDWPSQNVLRLSFRGGTLATFCWGTSVPLGTTNERFTFPEICTLQLQRFLDEWPTISPPLLFSKFSCRNVIAMALNLQQRPEFTRRVFGDATYLLERVFLRVPSAELQQFVAPFWERREPLSATDFGERLRATVKMELIPGGLSETNTSV